MLLLLVCALMCVASAALDGDLLKRVRASLRAEAGLSSSSAAAYGRWRRLNSDLLKCARTPADLLVLTHSLRDEIRTVRPKSQALSDFALANDLLVSAVTRNCTASG